ncbi:MAG TPA: Hsp70 family protein, partial [Arsenicitalea sp.]|nr:Hsp70 family protein [Arsenicitalea sp.]
KEQQIKIEASGGLTKEDIERMIRDAEAHAEEDKKRRALIEARNEAEGQIAASERALAAADSAPPAEKAAVQSAIDDLRTAIAGESETDIQSKTAVLAQATARLQAAATASPGPQTSDQSGGDEDVVDAEFEDVNDGEKRT